MSRRRKARRKKKGRGGCLLFGLLAVALTVFGTVGLLAVGYPDSAGPGSGREVELDVPWGGGPKVVAQRAEEAGVVADGDRFAWYLRLTGAAERLGAGRHLVRDDWTPRQVAEALTGPGRPAQVRVTLREGLSRFEMGEELEARGVCAREAFLEATTEAALLRRFAIPAPSAEGYLWPETYQMEPGSEPVEVVTRLLETFEARLGPTFDGRRARVVELGQAMLALEEELGWGPFLQLRDDLDDFTAGRHSAVILASLVEAETPLAEERPRVAAVALNRLTSPDFPFRRLQFDPTVRYGCLAEPDRAPSCQGGVATLATRHLEDGENRYSTYTHPGLPPGPIGNPAPSSIEAVLTPADTEDLYFVASGEGGHVFSKTLVEHNAAVARYRARRDSAGAAGGEDGEEPRDADGEGEQ